MRKKNLLSLILISLLLAGCKQNRERSWLDIREYMREKALAANRCEYFTTPDNQKIFYRKWDAATETKAVLLVIHGIGLESRPYKVVADALNSEGISVYAMDIRGHGLSDGKRGYLEPVETHANDIKKWFDILKTRHPDVPFFLLGESLGGMIALGSQAINNLPVQGMILVAPALESNPRQWLSPEIFFYGILTFINPRSPTYPLTDKRLNIATKDKSFRRERRTNPLAQQSVTFYYFSQYIKDASRWKKEFAPKINVPVLIQQGGKDYVLISGRAKELWKNLPVRDKKLLWYKDAHHTLFWDPGTPVVLRDIGKWIQEHL